ncbi:MAG: type II/IV secretion system protein [Proteobacteria bacterium]|nr:type II/IV secretion system protein [Pseudomonadota bacterium]
MIKPVINSLDIKEILNALVGSELLSNEDAQRISETTRALKSTEHSLLSIARLMGGASTDSADWNEDKLSRWVAEQSQFDFVEIDPLKVNVASITKVISYDYARKHCILPVEVSTDFVRFACANPFNARWKAQLEQITRKEVIIGLGNPKDIARFTDEFFNLAKSIRTANAEDAPSNNPLTQNLEQLVQLGKTGRLDTEDHHIVQLVDWLLQYAFEQHASDIHLEPRRDHGNIRFRMDGVLHNVHQVPPNVMAAIVSRIKTIGRMDIAEKRRPLDGRLKTKTPKGQEIELRLSTVPTAMGEKLVMRIFDPEVLQRSFEALGLNHRELALWHKLTGHSHGIVLVTGPTGSGKTTTLYSTLRKLAVEQVNVSTIEDPIEMVESAFNQIQVHASIDLDFAAGVRALLRQDPDIIMIGEIRDLETAEMAIQAALTGHLVLSTLHTNDSPSAITRLLELGVPAYLINASVLGVLSQRLARTLCPRCKSSVKIDETSWSTLTTGFNLVPGNPYQAVGCLDCRDTGYRGRIGLYEMMELTDAVKKLVVPNADVSQISAQAIKDGMVPLRIAGAQHIIAGETTLEEVIRIVPNAT